MSYFPVGHRFTAGEIDDFEDCDPAHYAGGYDIDLTYGRSLPPSYKTCYPYRSSASDHPQFASQSKPSAYAFEALSSEYDSFFSGPKARPGNPASAGGSVYSGPRPNFGFQPGGGVPEHGGRNDYARPEPGYGSGYGVKPPSSKFGSSHGTSSEYENPSLMHDYGESGYGPSVRNPASGFGGSIRESVNSGYGGWPENPNYPQPSYARPSYTEPGYPTPSYPEPSHPTPSYPEPSYLIPSYPEPRYPTPGYGRQKNEPDNSDHERRRHHQSHHHDRRH